MIHNQLSTNVANGNETETASQAQYFKKMWDSYSFHWPLFLISIAICLTLAVLYIKNTLPVYHVAAKLAMNDPKKDQLNAKTALEALDILQKPKVIENEVAILRSRQMLRSVVRDLNLWVNYQEPYNYIYKDLYTKSPLQFQYIKPSGDLEKADLDITVKNANFFDLKLKDGTSITLPFNKPLKNGLGIWQLNTTDKIAKNGGKSFRIQVKDPEDVVSAYQKDISVVLDKNAPIIDLQLDDQVPARGVKVLNTLIAVYKAANAANKNNETARTLKFIDERLSSLTQELTGVEKNVEDYKSSIGLTDITSQSQSYLDNIRTNDAKLTDVNIQLNVINGIERYVNSSAHTAVPATIGITDPGLVSLVEKLTQLELQRNRLLATTPEDNPIFAPVNSQIVSTKEAIREKVRAIKSSLVTTHNQLQQYGSNIETSIKSVPKHERQYVSIKRQQGIKENLYVYLLQKREEIALSYASIITDAFTVEDAFYNDPQTSAKMPVALALIFGFLIPVGYLSSKKALNSKVLTRDEIEQGTSAPIMCELMHSNENNAIVVLDRESYAIGEQFRSLRTSLLYVNNNAERGKVTLITSSVAGEGKSFVTSNIGASLAASGKKTIILELDLRRPKITKIFDLDIMHPGLSDFLNGEATMQQIIQPSGVHSNLHVMRSGSPVTNPSELLESEQMEQIINDLKYEYDNILIDSPPLKLVTDAMILAPKCDACLYVIRQNVTLKSDLRFIDHVYRSNKVRNMNLIFNGVRMERRYGYTMDWGYYADRSVKQLQKKSVFENFSHRF
ncbi:GumC family protein [Mucilaginibacter lacusdianchii]|uniref:GumC family protein n=1 Tax=Mucilaginibacter lacusdianchii TaxID=2684211 RepID=UPI00131BD602|nr:polysaccharide biosynthesis tyrosine autokinase [Mucilaginibacter sp. JXJ CY 39]